MESVSGRYTLTDADVAATAQHLAHRSRGARAVRSLFGFCMIMLFGGVVFVPCADTPAEGIVEVLILGGVYALALWVLAPLLTRSAMKRMIREMPGKTGAEYTVVADDDGIREESDAGEVLRRWTALTGIEEVRDYMFLFFDPVLVLAVPRRAFPRPEDLEAIAVRARACLTDSER